MADNSGWTDEDYRRADAEERERRRGLYGRGGRPGPDFRTEDDYGPGLGGRADDAYRDDDSRRYGEDPRFGRARGGGQPYSHARWLREQDDGQNAGVHKGRGPSDYVRSDDRIHEDVNERLADDGWLDASDVRVKVQKGEVTLGGLVGSRLDKRRAEAIADAVFGVKHTQNNLRVRDASMAKPGDEAFKEDRSIRDADDRSGRTN